MLSRRIVRASALRSLASRQMVPITQRRTFIPEYSTKQILDEKYPEPPNLTPEEDPEMNGGYINPPRVARQFRDPHGDWWDKQERRNFGEPVHKDHDILGMFTLHDYTFIGNAEGLVHIGAFIVAFLGVLMVVYQVYPDKPSYPREFEGGLERELGGPGALRARSPDDPEAFQKAEAEE